MLRFNVLSCVLYVAHAAAIYDHAQQPLNEHVRQPLDESAQKPLELGEAATLHIFPLVFNGIDKYNLPSVHRESGPPTLGAIQDSSTYRSPDFPYSVVTYMLFGGPEEGWSNALLTVEGAASRSKEYGSDPDTTWLDFDGRQAEHISLSSVGVRNGGMVAKPARSARLDLDAPFIAIPSDLFAVVLQATKASWEREQQTDNLLVDCDAMHAFPELVFGLETQTGEAAEIIVAPSQYVVRKGQKCMLSVKSMDEDCRDDVVLGWPAIRGREFVLDWVAGKMGFGLPLVPSFYK